MRVLRIVALLLIAGCTRQSDETEATASDATANAMAGVANPEVPALDGKWQLTKLDGRPVDAMAVTFAAGKASIAAGCNHRGWSFTQKRNVVGFTADPGASANCASSPSADDEAAFHAIDRATMAIFAKEGREANLSGNGGNVTLERS